MTILIYKLNPLLLMLRNLVPHAWILIPFLLAVLICRLSTFYFLLMLSYFLIPFPLLFFMVFSLDLFLPLIPVLWEKKKVPNYFARKEDNIDSSANKENIDVSTECWNRKASTFKKLERQSGSISNSLEITYSIVVGSFESI